MSHIRDRFDRLNWRDLRRLGNSRLVKTSYFWVLFVPTIARWVEPFAGRHTVIFFGKEFTDFSVDLPFSWRMLWWMSLFLVIGQGLYAWRCPAVVKQFSHYGDYRAAHAGPSQLQELLRHALHTWTRADITSAARLFQNETGTTLLKRGDDALSLKALRGCVLENIERSTPSAAAAQAAEIEDTTLSNRFDVTLGFSSFIHRTGLAMSAACLVIGVSLFVWLSIQTVLKGLPLILGTP